MAAVILAGVLCALVSGVAMYFWQRQAAVREFDRIERIREEAERNRIDDLERHYRDMLSAMKGEFAALSDKILCEKRAQFEREGLAGVERLTAPLMQEIRNFRERVERVNSEDVRRTAELKANIEGLVKQTGLVSEQADRLATAIRSDAQVTGQWGEIQLQRVLELGGLRQTVDWDYQETFTSPGSDRADLRTDVMVKMPDNRWLVIDAKTTMAAYVDYVGKDGERNPEALKRIIASLVEHVKEMKRADYHKKIAAATGKQILNTMFMYVPFEEVYLIAMKSEVDTSSGKRPLREWAWENDVVFVDASALVPVVRMLCELWARDSSERKAQKIREAAESLIRKFSTFLSAKDGFAALGASLNSAVASYNASMGRLATGDGNIVKKLSDLKEMGVPAASKLPAQEEVSSRDVKASCVAPPPATI